MAGSGTLSSGDREYNRLDVTTEIQGAGTTRKAVADCFSSPRHG